MASPSLTSNSILSISAGNLDLRPILQVLDVKEIGAGRLPQPRFRLLLSDGSFVLQGMLATQLNVHVKSGNIHKGTVVQLLEYICNTVHGRKIVMVLNLEIVGFNFDTIGDPKPAFQEDRVAVASSTSDRSSVTVECVSQVQSGTDTLSRGEGADGSSGLGASSLTPGQAVEYAANKGTLGDYKSGLDAYMRGASSETSPYGRPVVSSTYEPAPIYSAKGPIARNQAPARIVPIAALNPYQGRWTIKARVTAKGDLRRFHNAKGDGKVFHFDLLDAEGGEIRVTCFNALVDRFIDEIETGKVYLVSKGSLKPAQRDYNHLKNDWEIFLENSSTVQCCTDEDNLIPQQNFNFIPINEIENTERNAMVDVIGVVVAVRPTNTILRKNGTETQKRTAQLRDMSGCSVELTMWGSFCAREGQVLQERWDSGNLSVLAIKAGRISDFSGKSIGTISTTQLLVNPDLAEAHRMARWFENEGKHTSYQSISHEGVSSGTHIEMRKTVAQIKDEGLGRSDKPDWIAVKGTISFLKTDTFCYTACPLTFGERPCNKKVINYGGKWRCDRCDKSVEECDYRYLLSLQIQDHTGVAWVTAFQDAGQEILGVTAKELYQWKRDEDLRFNEVIQKLLFSQHLFKLRIKEDSYSDELRVKCTVIKTERLDFPAESRALLDIIGSFSRSVDKFGSGFPTSGFTGSVSTVYGNASMGYDSSSMAMPGQVSMQRHGHLLTAGNGQLR